MSGTVYGIVYCITNTTNGKQYVGQTIRSLKERWREHGNKLHLDHMQIGRAVHKYGRECFIVHTLEECETYEELNLIEEEWIKTLNTLAPNGYNAAPGGHHRPLTPEHYKNIAEKNRGRKRSDEFCEGLRQRFKGRVFTPEWIDKLSEAARRRKGRMPHKSLRQLEASHKALSMILCDGENNGNSKLTTEEVREICTLYATGNYSQQQLADKYGVIQAHVSRIIRGVAWKTSANCSAIMVEEES